MNLNGNPNLRHFAAQGGRAKAKRMTKAERRAMARKMLQARWKRPREAKAS